ncbi:amino acid/polyamine transporter I [Helicostylum pulchrum]|nr:amino acid/polyamine transporter I [Helicostylum pulchrum]
MKYSSYLNKFMVFWVGVGTIAVLCTVPAMAPKLNSAKWVFTEFTNNTGYESVVMVFFVGMLQAGWSLSGYVCGAQIVEGTKRADVTAPRGIIICVTGVIFQGLVIILITLFSIQDIDELIASKMPIATFFLRATNSPQVTALFLFILLIVQFGSLCNTILAASHFVFAFARDGCLPFSSYFTKLSEKTRVPERALLAQLIISILLIMPNFASAIYWQAIMSTAIISCNICYGMPFLCRLIWVRNDMPKGPFSLGRFGLILNFISVVWVSFFSVILCIPSVFPVTPETMNWASVMIGGVLMFTLLFWFISGRKNYEGKIHSTEKQ